MLGFVRHLSLLPDDSLLLDIFWVNIADDECPLPWVNWAWSIDRQFDTLGMAFPFIFPEIGALDNHSFIARPAEGRQ